MTSEATHSASTPSSPTESSPKSSPAGVLFSSALADCPPGTVLNEKALAKVLAVAPRTLRRMVDRGELPPGTKLGVNKVWLSDKVLAHLSERAERLAAEARQHAARLARKSF
ncbi:MAG TPA: hypothetical protein VGP72_02520 [Planctomycetota bacterium]|jgi:predicted DNA-binding transcriptional regulator AlpA